jgi:SAM-dependent methyltransferase
MRKALRRLAAARHGAVVDHEALVHVAQSRACLTRLAMTAIGEQGLLVAQQVIDRVAFGVAHHDAHAPVAHTMPTRGLYEVVRQHAIGVIVRAHASLCIASPVVDERSLMPSLLARTPEPELMDEDEQARAYSEARFDAPHEHCAELIASWWRTLGLPEDARALDLGCGPADVLVRVARRLPRASFVGVDGSEAMLRYGRERVARERLEDRVTLVRAFLPRDPIPSGPFPVVISNSLLHHLHDPHVLWRSVRAYAPGARVFLMDLMRPASDADVRRLVDMHTQGEPDVLRRDFEASLHAAFTNEEVRAQLAEAGLDLLVEAVSDRHLVARSRA